MGSLDFSDNGSQNSPMQGSESFLRNVLRNILNTYLNRHPTAKAIWELVQSEGNEQYVYDHFTFRTLGVDGYGINSMSSFFLDYGYKIGGGLDFPAKKIRAQWLSPPDVSITVDGTGIDKGPLPRIVLAEVLVDELSLNSQEIIRKYLKPAGGKQAILSSTLGSLIWEQPSYADFKQLAMESEFAAWTLIHGYTMNHVAMSVHRMKHQFRDIEYLKQFLEEQGYKLNPIGGIIKVSPDGLLQQISSVADRIQVEFADGVIESISASYVEYIQRHVMPEFKDLREDEIKEFHRKDGLEFGNANNIMESARFMTKV